MILYLHGFRSSPQSFKAQILGDFLRARGMGDQFVCPALPHVPDEALALCDEIIAQSRTPVTVAGSSLGGFYATWLAETHKLKAVLVNPAVVAPLALRDYLGPQTNMYTGEVFEFTETHIAQLARREIQEVTPARYLLLVEKGDEVLDYRQAVEKYAGARQVVLDGGDHSFTRFRDYADQILEFSGL
jgi:predicted esterase YcpF (UPF0227 family)